MRAGFSWLVGLLPATAPSLLSLVLPCNSLRPERLAYHAHRDAERAALGALERS